MTPLSLTAHIGSVSKSYQLCHQNRSRIWPRLTTSTSSTFILPSKPSVPLYLFPRISAVACSLGSLPPFSLQSIPLTATAGGLEHRNQMRPPGLLRTCQCLTSPHKVQSACQASRPDKIVSLFPASPLVPCHGSHPIALHLLLPWPLCHSLKTFSLPKCLTSRHPHGS